MLRINLINMPFSTLDLPSLALTQLVSRLEELYPHAVSTTINYLNHDFGEYLGVQLYQDIAFGSDYFHSGLGEWFFRQSAFPDLPDNSEEYFGRYRSDPSGASFRRTILLKRNSLDTFLDCLIDQYEIDRADIVGLTSMFAQNLASIAMARRLKARNPGLTVVMGGANCEPPMGNELARHIDVIDYIFCGPSLVSFPSFIEHTLNDRADQRGDIPGIVRCRERGRQNNNISLGKRTEGVSIGQDLDINVPVPLDYHSFLLSFEQHFSASPLEPTLLFETSRGCWWGEHHHCTFCGLNGLSMDYRAMRPEMALSYIQQLLRYVPRCSRFMCVDNIMPKNFVREVWPKLDNAIGALLFYEVKANMTADDLAVLSRAGVKKIQPGIEALATKSLQLMKKGSSACHNVRFLMNCLMNDVSPVWNLLVGFPGETESIFQKYAEDIPKLAHIPPPVGVFPVRFDRYSPYFNKPEDFGIQLQPFDSYDYVYPFGDDAIRNIAYYFTDDSMSDYQIAMIEWLDTLKEEVTAWRGKWIKAPGKAPRLYARSECGQTIVEDTRFGAPRSDVLTSEMARLLDHLQRPRQIDEALRTLSSTCGTAAGSAFEIARGRQWLFEDEERVVSLVMEHESPPMTTWIS